ncbi:MAG: sulfurtransferase [Steroidobacteraceae bacterium]
MEHRVKLGFMEFHTLIAAELLQGLLGEPRLAVVDCRFDLMNPDAGRQAYLRGHIPGARYADLNRDLSAPVGSGTGRHPLPTPEAFASWLGAAGIGNDAQIVAYDDANGSIAARLWWMLRWVGHDAIAVLDGGLKAWIARGGALQPGGLEFQGRAFTPRTDPRAAVSTSEVERTLEDPAALLVDARAQERYAGTIEPIDSVAGHVPGAVNHPFTANLDAEGRFLPAGEIRSRWHRRLGGKEPKNVIAMCGSGVTACHNLLSLEVAGMSGAKLYSGSWSEWIRDPKRPVARS